MRSVATRVRDLIVGNQPGDELVGLMSQYLEGLVQRRWDTGAVLHPLGFVYVPMLREGDGVLRLHLWLDGGTPDDITTSPYHMHTWNLASYVMCGSLQNLLLTADPHHGDLGPYQVFEIAGDRRSDELRATGAEVYATIDSVEDVKAGDIYQIEAGQFHTTVNTSDGDLVTVAYVQPVPGTRERSLGPVSMSSHVVVRENCPGDHLAGLARDVLARLP